MQPAAMRYTKRSIEFALDETRREVEFRLSVFADAFVEIRSSRLAQLSAYTWTFKHKRIECSGVSWTATGIAIRLGDTGRVIYGPYVNIGVGAYRLKITFGLEPSFARLQADVCVGCGTEMAHVFKHEQRHKCEITVRSGLIGPLTNVEFCLKVFGYFTDEFRLYMAFKVSDRERANQGSAKAEHRRPRGACFSRRRVGDA